MVQDRAEVSHLQFSDDTILSLPYDHMKFYNVLGIIHVFEGILSLRINLRKRGLVGLDVYEQNVRDLVKSIVMS